MGYLIDTNVLSELRKKQNADVNVIEWFSGVDGVECYVSVLTLGEIFNGIQRLREKNPVAAESLNKWLDTLTQNFHDRVLPITSDIALKWGEITAPVSLPVVDSLIASTAMVHNLTLVTRNIKDIEKTGAKLLNPFLN